jgi:uncharacterized protein (UPF0335 family)
MLDQGAGDELRAIVEAIEQLADKRETIRDAIAARYRAARAAGFDRHALRETIRLRAQDPVERRERAALVATYEQAVNRSAAAGRLASFGNRTADLCGDPAPGRSALDQRVSVAAVDAA